MVQHIYCIPVLWWADFAIIYCRQLFSSLCWGEWQRVSKVGLVALDVVGLQPPRLHAFHAYSLISGWVTHWQRAIAHACWSIFRAFGILTALGSLIKRFLQTSWEHCTPAGDGSSAGFFVHFSQKNAIQAASFYTALLRSISGLDDRRASLFSKEIVRVVAWYELTRVRSLPFV